MRTRPFLGFVTAALLALTSEFSAQTPTHWKTHDMSRPRPQVVSPSPQALPIAAPRDAVVLFNGADLSGWLGQDGKPAQWRVQNGVFETVGGAGPIHTERAFGDLQLHIEWASPAPAVDTGQGRGNSGVFLMGLYELQVLDSYQNDTYPDGQAGAIYGQHPPLVNASRPPGEWQTFDIFFRRPRFDAKGLLVSRARMTVLHNGLPVQDNEEVVGPTYWLQHLAYQKHPDKLPLMLQDHGNPVRFRNLWVRELPEDDTSATTQPLIVIQPIGNELADRFVGTYRFPWGREMVIRLDAGRLWLDLGPTRIPLIPRQSDTLALDGVDANVTFSRDASGRPIGYTLHVGGEDLSASRITK